MRIFGYVGFLIVWLLPPAAMAITVADTASVQTGATDEVKSPPQSEEVDLLNIWD